MLQILINCQSFSWFRWFAVRGWVAARLIRYLSSFSVIAIKVKEGMHDKINKCPFMASQEGKDDNISKCPFRASYVKQQYGPSWLRVWLPYLTATSQDILWFLLPDRGELWPSRGKKGRGSMVLNLLQSSGLLNFTVESPHKGAWLYRSRPLLLLSYYHI
jgi:hypothetical protein